MKRMESNNFSFEKLHNNIVCRILRTRKPKAEKVKRDNPRDAASSSEGTECGSRPLGKRALHIL